MDAVIIGGGLAGLVAALGLIEQGLRVTLVDRDTPDALGGLARESFGGLMIVGSPAQARNGITDTPEIALADWRRFGELAEGDRWPLAWASSYVEHSRAGIHDWLAGMGQKFLPMPLWVERDGNSVPRWHVCWGTGAGLVATILRALNAHPQRARLDLRFGIHVQRLLTEAGRVTGVIGSDASGGEVTLRAARVIIASGGITGDDGMVRRHWHRDWQPAPPVILNGGHRFGDGTLHHAAQAAGAAVVQLDRQWNYAAGIRHWAPKKPRHGLSLVPVRHAVWTDATGQRVMPPLLTGLDTRDLVTRICALPGGYGWQVTNRRIALRELAVSGAEMNPSIRDGSRLRFLRDILFGNRWLYDTLTGQAPDVVTAESLPDLVAAMNRLDSPGPPVDADRLLASIAGFDAQIAQGAAATDPQLTAIARMRQWRGDRVRLARGQRILDPKAGPLVAIRTFVIARKTLGGITTDLSCRVLDAADQPIPGLYAVGEAAGFGGGNANGLRGLEGTFLGGAIHTGRRLAQAIAGGN
ncbi:FAD-dependent oxidoreductase [Paracoccus sp. p3-h83]|uniref:FAD-dependent oxidoreductase n=1 Tax=Paracoccus sp. p3-h83 TaxID=3342805 RepID=UPI0035B8835A